MVATKTSKSNKFRAIRWMAFGSRSWLKIRTDAPKRTVKSDT